MMQAFLLRRAFPLTTALLGGFGVLCAIYSFTEAQVAAQALMSLGAALTVSYHGPKLGHRAAGGWLMGIFRLGWQSSATFVASALAVGLWLLAAEARAQSFILPTNCASIVEELKMQPPANGNRARAAEMWNNYQIYCAGTGSLSLDDINAVTRVMHPEMYNAHK